LGVACPAKKIFLEQKGLKRVKGVLQKKGLGEQGLPSVCSIGLPLRARAGNEAGLGGEKRTPGSNRYVFDTGRINVGRGWPGLVGGHAVEGWETKTKRGAAEWQSLFLMKGVKTRAFRGTGQKK